MAYIKINGRKDPLAISNEQALRIKDKLANSAGGSDEMVDLGIWFGSLHQIKSVELEYERKKPDEDYNRPLTSEERNRAKEMMARVRQNLEAGGMLKRKFTVNESRCLECRCLLAREYICRHECKECIACDPLLTHSK